MILHGVDTQVFHPSPDRAALRRELDIPADAVVLGCFGRVRARGRGPAGRIRAAPVSRPPRAHLILTGRITPDNRSFADDLKARIRDAGLEGRIRFLGEIPWDQVVRHYQALDLFCAPARWEGFGLTPLEAMACGVPTVASRVGASEALIRDGKPDRWSRPAMPMR
ncbi:glycosyltransferase family 4 protein [Paracoccus sp. DMF-8]|uniref:glycosyltransferase family 4 protein n=1 Tax=Paracoccus sp. DMF-8 TaxID=3019445 RepID=UPI0023E8060D|nr:glycosyltransferase family 4 protein [Paracoccus sp. DMF-8]MDF3605211.1 glycosyltransferase family 4 protein [Paracoccus sp. DMF-8]